MYIVLWIALGKFSALIQKLFYAVREEVTFVIKTAGFGLNRISSYFHISKIRSLKILPFCNCICSSFK